MTKQGTIWLDKTKNGLPAVWGTGGVTTGGGNATIIVGADGEELVPICIPRDGLASGRYALFAVEAGYHVIEVVCERPKIEIYVYRIDNIDKDTAGDYTASVSQLGRFQLGDFVRYGLVNLIGMGNKEAEAAY